MIWAVAKKPRAVRALLNEIRPDSLGDDATLPFRKTWWDDEGKRINLNRPGVVIAVLLQIARPTAVSNVCKHCASKNGPFSSCISSDDVSGGSCSGCLYVGASSCSNKAGMSLNLLIWAYTDC